MIQPRPRGRRRRAPPPPDPFTKSGGYTVEPAHADPDEGNCVAVHFRVEDTLKSAVVRFVDLDGNDVMHAFARGTVNVSDGCEAGGRRPAPRWRWAEHSTTSSSGSWTWTRTHRRRRRHGALEHGRPRGSHASFRRPGPQCPASIQETAPGTYAVELPPHATGELVIESKQETGDSLIRLTLNGDGSYEENRHVGLHHLEGEEDLLPAAQPPLLPGTKATHR